MRKPLLFLLALCLLLTAMPMAAFAEETVPETTAPIVREPGQCGDDLYWSYDRGTLTVSGTGAMDDYAEEAPWALYREVIDTVIFSGAVTRIGNRAFTDFDCLERVEFGGSIQEIGTAAFKSCDALTSITLPKGFRRFGEESFMNCKSLGQIHCNGGMPSFNLNCLWDTYTKIYFPVDNPWPLVHIEQLEDAFQGRIEFLAEDGSDPYTPVDETPPAVTVPETTEETTVPTTEPATVPTEAPTEAPTETTAPAKETTVPSEETVPAHSWQTVPPTEEPEPANRTVSGVWMGLALVTGTLSLVLLGALIFRRRRW